MKLPYQHTSIWINGREVSLIDICNANYNVRDGFEQNTFLFIKEWFSDQSSFTIQTSGSTGHPKLITLTREQLVASAQLTLEALQVSSQLNALVCLDTKYIAGRMMLVRSFLANLRIFAVTPTSHVASLCPPSTLFELAAFVPLQVYETLTHQPEFFNSINNLLIGGAALSLEAQQQLTAFTCKAFTTYGMTETISHVALHRVDGSENEIYHALPGIHFSKDERDCLVITGKHLNTQSIYTTDIVELLSDTSFNWLGRWDNIINTGGVKVIPEKIEQVVRDSFAGYGIHNHFFIGALPDQLLGQRVTLFVESQKPMPEHEILKDLRNHLTGFEHPREIVVLSNFQYTENGKVNRKLTIDQYITGKLNRLNFE